MDGSPTCLWCAAALETELGEKHYCSKEHRRAHAGHIRVWRGKVRSPPAAWSMTPEHLERLSP